MAPDSTRSSTTAPSEIPAAESSSSSCDPSRSYPANMSEEAPSHWTPLREESTADSERTLFVGDLPRTVSDGDLEAAFAAYGAVVASSVKRDTTTGRALGYGFVEMETHAQAVAAREALHGQELSGRVLRVGWAHRNNNAGLLVSGALQGVPLDSLHNLPAWVDGLSDVVVESVDWHTPGEIAIVRFRTQAEAEKARSLLHEIDLVRRLARNRAPATINYDKFRLKWPTPPPSLPALCPAASWSRAKCQSPCRARVGSGSQTAAPSGC
jgi:cold-inducible RNA-binding protein